MLGLSRLLAFYAATQLIVFMAASVFGLSQRGFLASRTHLLSRRSCSPWVSSSAEDSKPDRYQTTSETARRTLPSRSMSMLSGGAPGRRAVSRVRQCRREASLSRSGMVCRHRCRTFHPFRKHDRDPASTNRSCRYRAVDSPRGRSAAGLPPVLRARHFSCEHCHRATMHQSGVTATLRPQRRL